MAFKIPNFYAQQKQHAFAKGPEVSNVPSPLNVTYDAAYDAQSDDKKSKQSREEFKKAAKAFNKKEYGTTEPTKAASEGKITGDKAKKLIVRKLKAKKEREDVAKAKKNKETKPVQTKDKVVKNEEPKNRRQKRADRIKKRKEKKKAIKEVKDSGLKGKEKREAKRAVREKVGKTKVGKFLKKAKDKVVGDALGNEVKKDSPAKMTSPLNDSASSGKKHSTMGKQQLEIHIEGNNKHRNAKRLADADKDPGAGKNQIGSIDGPGDSKPSKKQYLPSSRNKQAAMKGAAEALSERVSKPKKDSPAKIKKSKGAKKNK